MKKDKNNCRVFTINDCCDLAIYENGMFSVKSKDYTFSISTLLISPPSKLIELLQENQYEGAIVIDLLAPNGSDAENRFFEVYFHDGKFDRKIENGRIGVHHIKQLYLTDKERYEHDIFYSQESIDLSFTVLDQDEIAKIKSFRSFH